MTNQSPPQSPKAPRPTLTLDVEKYQHVLDMPDANEAEKKEMIEAVWLLVVSFIDAGFDVRSKETCGKPAQDAIAPDSDKGAMLNSFQSQATSTFQAVANARTCSKEAS